MNENKIPSAEEFLRDEADTMDGAVYAMIEFTKIHVKAALKEALESIPCLGSSSDIATYEEVAKEVLNAYPEELIK